MLLPSPTNASVRPAQRSQPFPQRDEIRQRLARMLLVGQRVDHVKARGRRGEFLERSLRECPDDDARATHRSRFLATSATGSRRPERHVRLQRDDLAAQLAHRDFERRSRSERRLLEQHRHVAAASSCGGRRLGAERALRLQSERQLEAALEIGGVEVE